MTGTPPIALTIAGFDPSSGAGVTADLAVFAAHKVFGTAAITALTAQSTVGVKASEAVAPQFLRKTLSELVSDMPPLGIKVGMLATEEIVHTVADFLEELAQAETVPVVVDPVLISSSGHPLLEDAGVHVLIDRVLPLATWITPNRQEFARLIGSPPGQSLNDSWLEAKAREFCRQHPQTGLIVTGGDGDRADDLVMDRRREPLWLRAEKIRSRSTHGTGCAFSATLLCGLIRGLDGVAAAEAAKAYVAEAIRRAVPLGAGRGPMDLLWPLSE